MVLQKIIFQIFLDNKDIVFVLFVLNIIYMVLLRDQLYHNLGLIIYINPGYSSSSWMDYTKLLPCI